MLGRKLVAAASFVVFVSGAVSAQTAKSETARTEDLIKQAVERYAAGLEASRVQNTQAAQSESSVPLTLEDAVRRAVDNNLEMAVERLNPQTFDFTLASLRANYNPNATSQHRPARQRAPADQPAESRQPERLDDDLQLGHRCRTSRGAAATTR